MSADRYSDKRQEDYFAAYFLFSDQLVGSVQEVMAAAEDDYPQLSWLRAFMGETIDTRGTTLCWEVFAEDGDLTMPGNGGLSISGALGRCDVEWDPILHTSRLFS